MTDTHHQQHSGTDNTGQHHADSGDQQGTAKPAPDSVKDAFLNQARARGHVASHNFSLRMPTKEGAWGQTDVDVAPHGRFLIRQGVTASFDTREKLPGDENFFGRLWNDLFAKKQNPGVQEISYRFGENWNPLNIIYNSAVRKWLKEPRLLKEMENKNSSETKSIHIATNEIGLPAIYALNLADTPSHEVVTLPGSTILQGMNTRLDFTLRNFFSSASIIGNIPKKMELIRGDDVVVIGGGSMLSVEELKENQQVMVDTDLVIGYTTKTPVMALRTTSPFVMAVNFFQKKEGGVSKEEPMLASFYGPGVVIRLRDRQALLDARARAAEVASKEITGKTSNKSAPI